MRKIPFVLRKGPLILIALALSATASLAQLSGNYFVPGQYASLTNAGGIFDALNTQGTSGNISILITADLTGESGAVALNELAGGRTLRIKPDFAPRTITGTGANASLIKLNGADNVTIDGSLSGGTDRSLTLTNGNDDGSVIEIFSGSNGANNNTIKNCMISGNPGTTAGIGILALGNDGVPNSNNVIRNNQIFRVRFGVSATRNDGTTFDQNWIITGNSLGSTVDADKLETGIYHRSSQNFTISDNIIAGLSSNSFSNIGILIETAMDGVVSANRISGVTNTSTGPPPRDGTGINLNASSTTANITVSNNVVSDVSATDSASSGPAAYGIRILQGGGYKIYYNSINLSATQTDPNRLSAALYIEGAVNTAGSVDLRNNILVNSKTAGTRYAIVNASSAGAAVFSTINYNDYFAQNVGFSGGTAKPTLADWQAATTQDANSLSVNPSFYSATDLHITIDSPVRFAGTALPEFLVDFDGEIRFNIETSTGADEVRTRCPSFSETFDAISTPALPTGWTTAASGSESPWVTSTTAPASPPGDAFALEVGSVGVAELTTTVIAVPASNAAVGFLNLYNLEASSETVGYDGMVLEISINGGPFKDITEDGGGFFRGGYTHTIHSGFGSPIAGRMAWSFLSGGTMAAPSYKGTFVQLPSGAAGNNIQLKWRVACDSSTVAPGLPGVRIDNIEIFPSECAPPAAHHFKVTAPANATAGSAFNFFVTALGQSNAFATGYNGTVHFTSTDGAASLPANSTLTNGEGAFSATLNTGGNHTITATDTTTNSITGTSNPIAVPFPPTPTPTPTPTPSPSASPTPTPSPTPGLVGNVATRLPVGTGDNVLIEGFIVLGPNGSTKKIMVRALGPFLTQFGVTDALANPTLEIRDGSNTVVATNNDWRNTQLGGIITGDQAPEIEGSGLAPTNDLESAIIANLAPGNYTAVVRGVANTVGTGIVDAYDMSPASPARLANIATRGLIQPGDQLMIAGFIIQNGDVRAVVRVIGPSLIVFGITNALPDTTLQLRDVNGAIVRENDDWQSHQKQELENTGLQPGNALEAAIVGTIAPGQYTVQVRGKPETTGIGVVEIYFLQ